MIRSGANMLSIPLIPRRHLKTFPIFKNLNLLLFLEKIRWRSSNRDAGNNQLEAIYHILPGLNHSFTLTMPTDLESSFGLPCSVTQGASG